MPNKMDPKHIETVDNIVDGYKKVKTLYKENAEMINKLKIWFKEHRTMIIIVAVVLAVVGYYVYRQYQGGKGKVTTASKKTSVKTKSAVIQSENTDLDEEEEEL